MRNLTSINSTI